LSDWPRAEEAYRRAVEVEPDDPDAQRRLRQWHEYAYGMDQTTE
jgi:hypothetical protein